MKRTIPHILLGLVAAFGLFACQVVVPETRAPNVVPQEPDRPTPQQAVDSFVSVASRMEPVAEAECRARTRGLNCDFEIVVDTTRGRPPNAYQSLGASGRPLITFTVALIADVRNRDELAFILGHEAAHHISGHLAKTQTNAALGGIAGSAIGAILGVEQAGLDTLQNLGASVGARSYSKGFELQADQLGTIIAYRAGYNPLRGAEYFTRIPDPGDRFLGTHPPNGSRIETVRRTLATLN